MDNTKNQALKPELKADLLKRCKGCCENCGKSLREIKGYVYPKDGDSLNNCISNLKVVCLECSYRLKEAGKYQYLDENWDTPPKKQEEYMMLNGMLFLSFIVPALLAIMLKLPMNFFYSLVIIWVHEAGHGIWCLFGKRILCSFSGFMSEMLATLVPALICFREKRSYLGGCILIMLMGMSIQHNAVYMQSAEYPSGIGFGGIPLTVQSHDWSVIFRQMGVIKDSYTIGKFTEELGRSISLTFFAASILGAILSIIDRFPKRLTDLIGAGAIPATLYLIISGAGNVEIIISLVLSAPLLLRAINRRWF